MSVRGFPRIAIVIVVLASIAASLSACQGVLGRPTVEPSAVAVAATDAPTPEPTATTAPTATQTPTPAPTATFTPVPTPTVAHNPQLAREIVIDQDAQVVHIYEKGVETRTLPCSTGLPIPGKQTPAWSGPVGYFVGTFFAFDVYADEAWLLFDDGAGGILIHSAPYTLVDGKKVYQDMDALGKKPVSHGCIRLAPEDAVWFSQWKPQGVQCTILPLTNKG